MKRTRLTASVFCGLCVFARNTRAAEAVPDRVATAAPNRVATAAPNRVALAAPNTERWDLARTLSFALENAPGRLLADEARASTEDSERAARGGLFPSLTAKSAHGFAGVNPGSTTTEPWSSAASLEMSVPLYDNGQSWRTLRTARLASQSARLEAIESVQQLGLDVIRAYYDLSYRGYSLEAVKSRRDTLSKQFRLADSLYRQGLRTKVDVRRFEIQDQRAALELRQAEAEMQRSVAKLQALLGFQDGVGPSFVPVSLEAPRNTAATVESTPLKVEDLRARQIAAIKVEISREGYEGERRTLWPQLSLNGDASYGWANYLGNTTAPDPSLSWSALASLNFVIFDGGIRRANSSKALHALRSSELSLAKVDADLKSQMTGLEIDLQLLRGNLEANRQLRLLEEENYAVLEARYRDGKTNYLDLIDGLQSLLRARLGEYSGTSDFRLKEAEKLFYEGRIHEFK